MSVAPTDTLYKMAVERFKSAITTGSDVERFNKLLNKGEYLLIEIHFILADGSLLPIIFKAFKGQLEGGIPCEVEGVNYTLLLAKDRS